MRREPRRAYMKTNSIQPEAVDYFTERSKEIVQFCLRESKGLFARWPVPTLFAYVFFRLVDRTVFVLRDNGRITAVASAWGRPETEIRAGRTFGWKRSQDGADAVFIAEVIGQRRHLPRLARLLSKRLPGWEKKKVFTMRSEPDRPMDRKLVELRPELFKRMLNGST